MFVKWMYKFINKEMVVYDIYFYCGILSSCYKEWDVYIY